MGKKKRGHPDLEELLARPWCYYCERDFEDLKLLISHQKAKHFKCDRCGKRLNTAGGLSVHMNQVHKESLTSVENAIANRQGLDIEIFGLEGIPEDVMAAHNQEIIANFYAQQAKRFKETGNPPPGKQGATKKIKYETRDELKARLAEWRVQKANGTAPPVPTDGQSPSQGASPFPPPQAGYPYPPVAIPGAPPVPAVPSFSPGQAYPPTYPPGPSPPPGAPSAFGLPPRPPAMPGYPYNGGVPPPGFSGNASTVDELVAGASRQGDEIDQIIRMAESGIKPGKGAEETPTEKKSKKDKSRMFYSDSDISPEEKMAILSRYRFEIQA